jgi:hypothetical protein
MDDHIVRGDATKILDDGDPWERAIEAIENARDNSQPFILIAPNHTSMQHGNVIIITPVDDPIETAEALKEAANHIRKFIES